MESIILPTIAQLPPPTSEEVYSGLKVLLAALGLVYLSVVTFKAIWPSRRPPIEADLAALATKCELHDTRVALENRIAADIAQHELIKDVIRREVHDDMAAIRAHFDATFRDIHGKIASGIAADEDRARRLHSRIDGLVERAGELVGKVEILQGKRS